MLFSDGNVPREEDADSTGVFYRNGDMAADADPENACFEESGTRRIWYYDGVNYFGAAGGLYAGRGRYSL